MARRGRGSSRGRSTGRPSTSRPIKVAPSLPTAHGNSTARPYYTAPRNDIENDDISCACDRVADDYGDMRWFECTGCQTQQHVDCATPNTGVLESVSVLLCNGCKVAELHRYFTSQREQFEQLANMLREKRAEAYDLCAKVLWRHYCNLPRGHLPDDVLEITKTEYSDGAMVPAQPAPRSWVEEVQNRIAKMVGDAGEEAVEHILGSARAPDLITDTSHLAYWRELAMWLLYKGPYRGNKAELGLLAEVLGLKERGTFWQEGWVGVQIDLAEVRSSATLHDDGDGAPSTA